MVHVLNVGAASGAPPLQLPASALPRRRICVMFLRVRPSRRSARMRTGQLHHGGIGRGSCARTQPLRGLVRCGRASLWSPGPVAVSGMHHTCWRITPCRRGVKRAQCSWSSPNANSESVLPRQGYAPHGRVDHALQTMRSQPCASPSPLRRVTLARASSSQPRAWPRAWTRRGVASPATVAAPCTCTRLSPARTPAPGASQATGWRRLRRGSS
jgi:hypothetical protein